MVIAPSNTAGTPYKYCKAELEKVCLAEAGCHFTQAQDTPLLTPPLIDWGSGWFKEIRRVLDGTFKPPPHCNMYAAKFYLRYQDLQGSKK